MLIVPISAYILLRFLSFAQSDLWYDEVFSVLAIRQNWTEMFSLVVKDAVHPPLFYILLKFWSVGNDSIWWLQLFPFLISILTLIPLRFLCRELKLTAPETAVVFLLIAVNDFFLEYSLDLRMYGLVQFLTLFSLWSFVRLLKSDEVEHQIVWTLAFFNLLLVYTHYFGWLVVALQGLYLVIWKRRFLHSFAISSASVLLCFAPWIWLLAQTAANNEASGNLGWLARPSFRELIWFYTILNGNLNLRHTTFINLIIFAAPMLVLSWREIRDKTRNLNWQILFYFAFVPVVLVFILSYLSAKPFWGSRYLIIVVAVYIILLVKSTFAFRNRLLRFAFVGIIITWSLVAGVLNLLETPKKIEWSRAAEKIKTESSTADALQIVYAENIWIELPLRFYLNELKVPAQVKKQNNLIDIREEKFWLVLLVPEPEKKSELIKTLNDKNCRVSESIYYAIGQDVMLLKVENCGQSSLQQTAAFH